MQQLIFDFLRPDYPGFDKFTGRANDSLLQMLKQQTDRFLYIWGEKGCGKSHLLQAWTAQAQAAGRQAAYIDPALRPLTEDVLPLEYLAVDNADTLDESEQTVLFDVFNRFRHSNQGFLLLSAEKPPAMLTIREDLRSRMACCLIHRILPLSDEEKAAALAETAYNRQIDIDPGIFDWLLTRHSRDMDSLMSMLDTLAGYAALTKRRITLPVLRRLLKEQEHP